LRLDDLVRGHLSRQLITCLPGGVHAIGGCQTEPPVRENIITCDAQTLDEHCAKTECHDGDANQEPNDTHDENLAFTYRALRAIRRNAPRSTKMIWAGAEAGQFCPALVPAMSISPAKCSTVHPRVVLYWKTPDRRRTRAAHTMARALLEDAARINAKRDKKTPHAAGEAALARGASWRAHLWGLRARGKSNARPAVGVRPLLGAALYLFCVMLAGAVRRRPV